tara:strand:+ start:4915 stop:5358 length:444 start_codon:yes stop_codon:yes gene_type:complete
MKQTNTKTSKAIKMQKENVVMNTSYMRAAKKIESSYMTPMFMQKRNNNQYTFDSLLQDAPLKKKRKNEKNTKREPLQFYMNLEDENGEEMKVSYESVSFLKKVTEYKPKMKQVFYKHTTNVQRGVGANIQYLKAEQKQLPNSFLNKK